MVLLAAIVFLCSVVFSADALCHHDDFMKHKVKDYFADVVLANHPKVGSKILGGGATSPIRIVPYYTPSFYNDFTSVQEKLVQDGLNLALKWFSQTLQVIPVSGALKFPVPCGTYWPSGPNSPHCASVSSASPQCMYYTVPKAHLADTVVCPTYSGTCTTQAGGSGISSADFVIYVQHNESLCYSGDALASGPPRIESMLIFSLFPHLYRLVVGIRSRPIFHVGKLQTSIRIGMDLYSKKAP